MAGTDGRRPTMKDVAALANVSLSTVSRFINGEPGRPELFRRIQEAIDLLGYQRDLTASTLRRADRASASVGVVVADVGNPFFAAVLRGIEEVARARGSVTVTASSDEDPDRERELAAALIARRIDGLIVVPAADDSGHLRAGRVPVAFVDRPPRFLDADAVLSDNAGGTARATGHLVGRGHTRIGFLGDRAGIFTCTERLRGYRSALASAGLPDDPALVRLDLDQGVVGTAVAELLALPRPPTALIASQNLLTIGAVRALRRLGQQHLVAFIGFDEVPLADVVEPSVTIVAQHPVTLGRRAAELLFERIGGYTGPGRTVVVETELIMRASSEVGARLPAV
jgi:LacI family transcriptional regulator, galactose operon repressor